MIKDDKDYCSGVSEFIQNIYVGDCCKAHDNAVGQAGTYNPFTPHIAFYKCLDNRVKRNLAIFYTIGGTIGSWWKYPYLAIKIYKYRKVNR